MNNFTQLFQQTLYKDRGRAIQDRRTQALSRFADMRFPTRRDEDWKYTAVNRIVDTEYALPSPVVLGNKWLSGIKTNSFTPNTLVFVNGMLIRELSNMQDRPESVHVMSVQDALENSTTREILDKYFLQNAKDNVFTTLNTAFSDKGLFVHIPKNSVVKNPIRFVYVITAKSNPVFVNPQHYVLAEANSQVTFVDEYITPDENTNPYFNNIVNRFVLQEGAKVDQYTVQEEGAEAYQVSNTDVWQEANSTYSAYLADLGGRIVRHNANAHQKASGALTNLYGVYHVDGKRHVDNQTYIDHAFPHCQSNELYKGILKDSARGVFNGKVMVRQDAQKINAFQQSSTLLLSEKAVMDSKPQLEIFADDVRCSHGATIGQLDNQALFYLRSRGLTEAAAKAMLTRAFIMDVMDRIEDAQMREYMEARIAKKLEGRS